MQMTENEQQTADREEKPAKERSAAERSEEKLSAAGAAERTGPSADESGVYVDTEVLYQAASANQTVRTRIIEEYLRSLKRAAVPVVSGGSVPAPENRPKTLYEAGKLAAAYFRKG